MPYRHPLITTVSKGLFLAAFATATYLICPASITTGSTQQQPSSEGLALDSIEAMLRGGDSGRLDPETIRDFETWVRMGAPAPKSESRAANRRP